jgi:iron complex outermembrane receptor protein
MGNIDLTGGLFYFEQDNINTARIDIAYVGTPFPFDFITDQTYDSESIGLYGHAVIHLSDRLNLTAGVRYSDEEKFQILKRLDPATGGRTGSTIPPFAAVDPITGFAGSNIFEDERVDYRLSADYRFNESFMGYATVSTGFKSGGVSPRFFFLSHILPYGVEEVLARELGFKADLFDYKLRLNAAYFDNQYDDQQLGSAICPDLVPAAPCLADRNLVDSNITGFEVELTYYATDTFLIDASLSTIDLEFTRVDPNVSSFFRPDATVPEQTPETKLTVGIQNEFSLGSSGTLIPRLDIIEQDETNGFNRTNIVGADLSRPLTVRDYTLVNASLTWRSADEDWETVLAVTNLTDEEYFYNNFDISTFGGWAVAQVAPPMEWAMSIRRNF